jgi:DNA-binding protein Fis
VDEGVLYCNRAIEYITQWIEDGNPDKDEVKNLGSGIEWLIEVLNKVVGLLELDPDDFKYRDKNVSEYTAGLKKTAGEISGITDDKELLEHLKEDINLFTGLKEIFRTLMMSREMKDLIMKSIDSPDILMESLQVIRDEVSTIAEKIEDAAVSFQTGKDEQGFERLNEFIDFMLRYTRTCYQVAPVFGIDLSDVVVNDESLESKNGNFMGLLNDIVEAMEYNDIISLSDILEYEIKPSLEEIEKTAILAALEASGGNKSETARKLGINRRTLYKKLEKFGVI